MVKHDALYQAVYDPRWHRQLMGLLASITLENKVRQELGLYRAVCEYEDVFSDELPRLSPYKDVDFTIELHSGTSCKAPNYTLVVITCLGYNISKISIFRKFKC